MDNTAGVGRGQRLGHLRGDVEDLLQLHRAGVEPPGQ